MESMLSLLCTPRAASHLTSNLDVTATEDPFGNGLKVQCHRSRIAPLRPAGIRIRHQIHWSDPIGLIQLVPGP